ncbi:MAG: YwiC-like family protein [Cyanobacteria bacterium P01_A01_bin.123]
MAYNLEQPMTLTTTQAYSPKSQQWYRPTLSPEHGVYVMLVVSFLTGAAAAQHWTWVTTLALICAFCGFQAEHPLLPSSYENPKPLASSPALCFMALPQASFLPFG